MINTFTDHYGYDHSLLGCAIEGSNTKERERLDKEWIQKAIKLANERKCHVFWNLKEITSKGYGICQYFLVPIDPYDAERIPYLYHGTEKMGYWIGISYYPDAPWLTLEEMNEIRRPYLGDDSISGYDYEEECADELRRMGFVNVEVTQKSGDQGIDIIAYKGGQKYGIQCKHYQGSVSNKAVQEAFAGGKYYHCDVAMVMTNATFTESAKDLAREIGVKLLSSNQEYKEV